MTTRERLIRWFPLLIIGSVILAYANCFSGTFIFDDHHRIVNNPDLFSIWPPWEAISRANRWVVDISFSLNHFISNLNPADYHATNILIHLLAALALYGIVRRTLLLPRFNGRFTPVAPWLALLISGLWAVHPLQTESVTYIVQRDESMMGLFFLLTLYAFIRGAPGSPRPRLWNDLALVACILGLGTKEVFVTLPFVLVIYDAIFLSESYGDVWRKRWKIHLVMFLSLGIWVCQMMMIRADLIGSEGLVYKGWTTREYFLTQIEVIPHYLLLAFIPDSLCLDYLWQPVQALKPLILPGLFLVGLGIWALYAGLIRRKPAGFLGVSFFLILGPTSSFMALPDAAFEHRMYLPLASVMAAFVMGGYALISRFYRPRAEGGANSLRPLLFIGFLSLALMAIFIGLTRFRNQDYLSEERMWRDVINKRPDNYRAYIGLSKGLLEECRFKETIDLYDRLLKRLPDFGSMSFDAIIALAKESDLMSQKIYYYAYAKNNCGIALSNLERVEEAYACFSEAIRVQPYNVPALNNMGFELYMQGKTNDAIAKWSFSIAIDRDNISAHGLLGALYEEQKNWALAIQHYRDVLRVKPNFVYYQFRLAWLLAGVPKTTLRDGKDALRLTLAAMDATERKSAKIWDLLGIVLAENGDYINASVAASNALKLLSIETKGLPPSQQLFGKRFLGRETTLDKAEVMERINLYSKRQPFLLPQ